MSCFSGPNITDNNLVLYLDAANLRSYSPGDTTWYDISGYNRNATLFDSVSLNSANSGVMDFSRSPTKGYATIPHDAQISSEVFGTSTVFTLCAWVYVRAFVDYGTLIQKSSGSNYSNSTCGLWVESPTFRRIRLVVGSNVTGNPAGSYISVSFSGANTFTWYNVVGVGNGTTASLYINGNLIGSVNFSDITVTRTENTNPIVIGPRSDLSTPELDALIGPISVYKTNLTEVEIRQNFNALRGRFGL